MKFIVLCCLFLMSLVCSAADLHFEFSPLSSDLRFERDESQQTAQRQPLDLVIGVNREQWALLLEFSRFHVLTGNEYVGIERQHQEALLWVRNESVLSEGLFYGGLLGLGASQEDVTSKIGDLRANDSGAPLVLLGVGVEGGLLIQKTLRLSLEGRLFYGTQLDPAPQPDVAFRLGLVF